MSRLVFPYGIRFREDRRIETFPAVEVVVRGRGNEELFALFHVDSGATTSVLPMDDAGVLGISLRDGEKTKVRGIFGNEVLGYQHTVTFQFQNLSIRTPVLFVSVNVPRILGREGIFEKFGILFDEAKRKTVFLEEKTERRRLNVLSK